MDYAWVNDLIGREWIGSGPEKFDCWDLVRLVEKEQFGRDLPPVDIDAGNLRTVLKMIKHHPVRSQWIETDERADGNLVKFFRVTNPDHLGVWINADGGGVLHCCRGQGVVFDSLLALKAAGWGNIRFFRYVGDDNAAGSD